MDAILESQSCSYELSEMPEPFFTGVDGAKYENN